MYGLKPSHKKVIAVVVIVALVSTIGYGVYRYTTRAPDVTFTTVNFNVNYQGNFSNYLVPVLLASNGTPINDSLISSTYHVYRNANEPWQFFFFIRLSNNPGDPGNSIYQSMDNYGYGLNNSAVIESIASTTPGLTVSSIAPSGEPFPVNPTFGSLNIVRLNVDTMYYHGPLNITINASAPAQNIVFYNTNFSIKYSGNASSPYAESGPHFDGFGGLPHDYQAVASPSGIGFSVWLASPDNFSITGIKVSTPFSIPQNSYVQPVRELNGGSYGYYDDVNFTVTPPNGPFVGNLTITVYTR